MVKKLKQKKKKLIVDKDLLGSLQASGFPGEIKNKAYMAPIQREILEYKKIKKKRKKARKKILEKKQGKKEIPEITKLEIQEKPEKHKIPKIPKIGIISKIQSIFKKRPGKMEEIPLTPKIAPAPIQQTPQEIPITEIQPIQTVPLQPLSSAQVIKEIKKQETPTKKPKENLFPDIQKLDHHVEEIEIVEHEPTQEKKKKEGIFSKVKSLFKSEKKEDDLYTLEPITATSTKSKLKDIEDASSTHYQQKDEEKKQEKTEEVPEESSSIGMLFNEKKKKTTI